MPYEILKLGSCPESKPWALRVKESGSVLGCHDSESSAERQMRAVIRSEVRESESPAAELLRWVDAELERLEEDEQAIRLGVMQLRESFEGEYP